MPRIQTGYFRSFEAAPGHVESVGAATRGGDGAAPLGARVRLWPTLPAAALDMLPRSWGDRADLERVGVGGRGGRVLLFVLPRVAVGTAQGVI